MKRLVRKLRAWLATPTLQPSFGLFIFVLLSCGARVAQAAGGADSGHQDLRINWWTWDAHKPPLGWFIVDFLVFVGLIVKLGGKKIAQAFKDRHETIKQALAVAENALKQATQRFHEYKQKLANVKNEAQELVALKQQAGDKERQTIVTAAETYAKRLQSDASNALQQEVSRLEQDLRLKIAHAALAQGQETLQREIKTDDQLTLLEQAIVALENLPAKKQSQQDYEALGSAA